MRKPQFVAGFFVLLAIAGIARSQLTRPPATRFPTTTITLSAVARPMHAARSIGLPQSQQVVTFDVYQVPQNMRLVIEYVSFGVTASVHDGSAVARLKLGTTSGGTSVFHDVITSGGPFDMLGGSQEVKIYADPGSRVQGRIDRRFSPTATGSVTLSGYLEPISTPFKAAKSG